MMHTCYNCNRPTGGDYRIVGFDIGPDGIPVNVAFCADCRARGVILATKPEEAARPADLGEREEPKADPALFMAQLLAKRPARVELFVWVRLLALFTKTVANKETVWYWDGHKNEGQGGWVAGAVIDEATLTALWEAPS